MRLGLVGVGLIGASLALGLRRAHPDWEILAFDRDEDSTDEALRRGLIDEAVALPALAVCELVVLAIPVRQMPAAFTALAPHLARDTVVTDAGSTKQAVIDAARTAFGAKVGQFVPGHPIAGREKSGVGAAAEVLFEGRQVVLTPIPENAAEAVTRVSAMWQSVGARVTTLDAAEHDAVFAAVSHLPHLIAFALVDELAARPNARQLFSFAASGFRDFTRIAGSSPAMWRDIALDNRASLVTELAHIEARLAALRGAIERGDAEALERVMADARRARERWMAGELEHFRDDAA